MRRAGAFEVLENLADQLRVLNTGDDLQRPAAVLAGLDVDVEDALQALRPTHGHVPRGCPRLFLRRAVCATELGRHDPRSQAMIRRKHPVVTRQVHSRTRHQSGQSRQKIQRLEYHVRRAIAVRGLQRVANGPLRGARQALDRHRRARNVAAQPLELLALPK